MSTDAAGAARFSLELEGAELVPEGEVITATATGDSGSTSELSAPKKVVRQ